LNDAKEGIIMYKIPAALLIIMIALYGCMAGGHKYVDLYYAGSTESTQSGNVGISSFIDSRPGADTGYVGTRYLGKGGKETYFALGDDLALSVTGICKSYITDTGFTCTSIPHWNFTPEGVKDAGQRFDFIVGGEIRTLDCFAVKKMGFTSMTLDIDLVVYIGTPDRVELKTIPVKLKLERNEITFTEEKLQGFLNISLLEVFQKALSSL
jgi:hypothetical protein